MSDAIPVVHLSGPWKSSHPWIFQRLLVKPEPRPRPGSIVDVVDGHGAWVGRGFYNGHARIGVRLLEGDRTIAIDRDWFARKIAAAVSLRRDALRLDDVTDAWRVVHSEGDGISGLVVDRYANLLVVEYFSAGAYRHRDWIHDALERQFPGCRLHAFADAHVQKQESFDCKPFDSPGHDPAAPARVGESLVTEYGVKFQADPSRGHKTGFFADQRENRHWLGQRVAGKRVLDLCCNSGGFAVHAAVGGATEVVGIDIDDTVLQLARENAELNGVQVEFVHAEIGSWLREATRAGRQYDVVVLDPARMTRDRRQVPAALKKYLDMNKRALAVIKPGGLFATFSCTGLVDEAQFLGMLRRAALHAGRTLQVLKVSGAGADHPWLVQVPESRYLKAAFCRVLA